MTPASCLRIFTLLSCLLALAPARAQEVFSDLSSQPIGQIYFNSVTPKSKWDLVHRKYDTTPTRIWGHLAFPEKRTGKVPAMVIAHGSNGVSKKLFERWAKTFNDMGIATFVVDSFGGRGIGSTMEDQSQLSPAANDADALFALKLLATDPRIDASRIGIIGFSRGGIVAMEMAMDSFRRGVIDNDVKFAALVGFYPGCTQVWWESPPPALTGAPMMLALGEKDDYTPAKPCQAFVPRMQAEGQSVEVHVYPGAYHDFDNVIAYFQYHPGATSSRNCQQTMLDIQHGAYYNLEAGTRYPSAQALGAYLKQCVTRGVSIGASPANGARSVEDVRKFITAAFHLE